MDSQLLSPIQGTVLSIDVELGDEVIIGQRVALLESMKMEHEITATSSGTVEGVHLGVGETVLEDQIILSIEPREISNKEEIVESEIDLEKSRIQNMISDVYREACELV